MPTYVSNSASNHAAFGISDRINHGSDGNDYDGISSGAEICSSTKQAPAMSRIEARWLVS